MNKVSTLENFNKFSYGRATGNTTRLIDHAIQLLFEGKIVIVHDAWENGQNENANEHLFNSILRRFKFEHGHIELITNKRNKKQLSIQIK